MGSRALEKNRRETILLKVIRIVIKRAVDRTCTDMTHGQVLRREKLSRNGLIEGADKTLN